jgi:hypothetical protein
MATFVNAYGYKWDPNFQAETTNNSAHRQSTSNPHNVTKGQLGLENVTNVDLSGDVKANSLHRVSVTNPHNVTPAQIGLGNVPNIDLSIDVGMNNTHRALGTNPHNVTPAQIGLGNVTDVDFTYSIAVNTAHRVSTATNPHNVTKGQVGLSQVLNVDLSTDVGLNNLNRFASEIHLVATGNPHNVTKDQVGLSNVLNENYSSEIAANLAHRLSAVYTHSEIDDFINSKGQSSGIAELDATGKIPANRFSFNGLQYMGSWNADTNIPNIQSGIGVAGQYYIICCNVVDGMGHNMAGTTIDGISDWQMSDHLIFNGTAWEKIDNTDQVASVAGRQGVIVLLPDDVGLGVVPNIDFSGPVSDNTIHRNDTDNPHGVTLTQLGLGTSATLDFGNAPYNVPRLLAPLGLNEVVVTDGIGGLITEAKGTAHNKDFGTGQSTCMEGNAFEAVVGSEITNTLTFAENCRSAEILNDIMYLSTDSNIYVIDIGGMQPLVISVLSGVVSDGMYISGDYLFTGSQGVTTFRVWNITEPKNVTEIGTGVDMGVYPFRFIVRGSYIFSIGSLEQLRVRELSSSTGISSALLSSAAVMGDDMIMLDNYILTADRLMIDIRNPRSLGATIDKTIEYAGGVSLYKLTTSNGILYAFGNYDDPIIRRWDVRNPNSPILTHTVSVAGPINTGLYIYGCYLIACTTTHTVLMNTTDLSVISSVPVSSLFAVPYGGKLIIVEHGNPSSIRFFEFGVNIDAIQSCSIHAGSVNASGDITIASTATIGGSLSVGDHAICARDMTVLGQINVHGGIHAYGSRLTGISDPIAIDDCVNKSYSDIATTQNALDIVTVQDDLLFHRTFMNGWKDYSSTVNSYTVTTSPTSSDSILENDTDTTSLLLDSLGVYRITFSAQCSIDHGDCDCAADLITLITELEFDHGTFISHVATYGSNEVLQPGIYKHAGATSHTGYLYLDANGDPDAVFVFIATGAHAIAAAATTILLNDANASNVFWVTTGALSMTTNCVLKGTYISKAAVAAGIGLVLTGRIFTTGGAIALADITATVPTATSQYELHSLETHLLYTTVGAISTTNYTSSSGDIWRIETGGGLISGFSGAYDGLHPSLDEKVILTSYSIYSGGLVPASIRYIQTNSANVYSISTTATIMVTSEEQKQISVHVQVLSQSGGLTVEGRTLFAQPVQPLVVLAPAAVSTDVFESKQVHTMHQRSHSIIGWQFRTNTSGKLTDIALYSVGPTRSTDVTIRIIEDNGSGDSMTGAVLATVVLPGWPGPHTTVPVVFPTPATLVAGTMYVVTVATTEMIFIGIYTGLLALAQDDPYLFATGASMDNYDTYASDDTGGESTNEDWEANTNIYPWFSATVSSDIDIQLL